MCRRQPGSVTGYNSDHRCGKEGIEQGLHNYSKRTNYRNVQILEIARYVGAHAYSIHARHSQYSRSKCELDAQVHFNCLKKY